MKMEFVKSIINEELKQAIERIEKRICQECECDEKQCLKKTFPNYKKYSTALSIYEKEINHSLVARTLGVSINSAKKYYNWLVINEYLPKENAELSNAEKLVAECIFEKHMSLKDTAKELNCSVTNVVYRRDAALRKGYKAK